MCGRFTLTVPTYELLASSLGIVPSPEQAALYRPRYNVAPGNATWILRMRDGVRELSQAEWGLVPRWTKELSGARRPINARGETLRDKPSFRSSYDKRRCVVVSDGFFEWRPGPRGKEPVWFHPKDGGLLLYAGLYDEWRDPEGAELHPTFAVITTTPNELVRPVHDRMPAVLRGDAISRWLEAPLDPSTGHAPAELDALLTPTSEGVLIALPVSRRVNDVHNDDPSLLRADEPAAANDEVVALGQTLSLFGEPAPARTKRRSR